MVILERDNVFYCDCGFTWQRGKSGTHECADGLRLQVRALAAENAALKDALECVINPDNQPEFHVQGMGCGIEDRGYQRDGYSACAYGWESAMERVYSEVIPDAIPETPDTDAFLTEVRAQGVEMFAEHCQKRRGEMMKSEPNEAASNEAITAIRRAGEFALFFAAQLRKEAAQ